MKTFLLVDAANLLWRAAHVTRGDAYTRVGLAAHIVLNSLPYTLKKFNVDHVVFCYEGRSWRKQYDSSYKLNRKVTEAKRTIAEQEMVDHLMEMQNEMKTFIEENTNATVLQHRDLEADDLVAGWINFHPDDNHVILSSDSDFLQLVAPNVKIFNAISKTTYTFDGVFDEKDKPKLSKSGEPEVIDAEYYLFEKIIRGDTSDNIRPSYPGARVKGSKNKVGIHEAYNDRHKQGFAWNTFMNSVWTDENGNDRVVKDCFEHNKLLIDLHSQPDHIKDMIIDTIAAVYDNPKNISLVGLKFLKFCGKYELNTLAANPTQITAMLAKGL